MYPNPQQALPLPPARTSSQYRKLAKDLVKACKSGEPAAIREWAVRWIEKLAALQDAPRSLLRNENEISAHVDPVEQFARKTLSRGDTSTCALTDAQFVIARAHGFLSWPKFVKHVESLAHVSSTVSAFERAVSAIVTGDAVTLKRVLRDHPKVTRARSTREHGGRFFTMSRRTAWRATGRCRLATPRRSPRSCWRLAPTWMRKPTCTKVDAHRSGWSRQAVLLSSPAYSRGSSTSCSSTARAWIFQVLSAIETGWFEAACRTASYRRRNTSRAVAHRSIFQKRQVSAGLTSVKGFFDADGNLKPKTTQAQMVEGFGLACAYGRTNVVDFLLDQGMEVDTELRGHGEGHTGLHVAAFHGQIDVVKTLLRHGARVDSIDKTWGTPPLVWALTGWDRHPAGQGTRYYEVVARLVAAGANVTPDLLAWDKAKANPKMLSALTEEVKMN